jgi:hypothetical protein
MRSASRKKPKAISLKMGYDYKQRYLADFNAGYNGSSRFGSGHQFGFFPAGGIGWNAAKENFWIPLQHTISLAKLRASYGVVGSDVAPGNQYLYQQVYNSGPNLQLWPIAAGRGDHLRRCARQQ